MESQQINTLSTPNQPTPSLVPTSSSIHRNLKILLLVFLFLLLGITGVFGYQMYQQQMQPPMDIVTPSLEPTPELIVETSEWKTYRNEEFEYEIQYPTNHELLEYTCDYDMKTAGIEHFFLAQSSNIPNDYCKFQEGIYPFEVIVEKGNVVDKPYNPPSSTSTITVGGISGKQYNWQPSEDDQVGYGPHTEIRVYRNSMTYVILIGDQELGDNILSMFQFVEEKVSTKDWKTYESNNKKFSLMHPPTWVVEEGGDDCPIFSDIPHPRATSAAVLKKGHIYIEVCMNTDDMPSTIPYAISNSVKPFSVNNYMGLRAKQIFVLPGGIEGENVYLQNPSGGYISLGLHAGDIPIFDTVLSSFRFIDKNQGKIKISDGNVYLIEEGKQQLIANKKDFKDDSYAPPIKFTDAVLSPDQRKVLLIAQGDISSNLLFYSDLNNISFKYVNTVSQAKWSNNSRYIAFNSHIADAGEDYFLGIYDSNSDKTVDISKQSSIKGIPSYSNIRWQDNDSGIIVHYSAQDGIPYGKEIGEDDITIPLTALSQ